MLINGLYIGNKLPLISKLTINSFLANGYAFRLWTYSPTEMESQVPSGVDVEDADLIIPESQVFTYTGNGDCRKGSYGGFSDLFRYALLYQEGGIYVDMDVTCLKRFEFSSYEYVIRPHVKTGACANIIKVPKKSVLMRNCFLDMDRYVNSDNSNWYYPLEILNHYIKENNLTGYIASPLAFGMESQQELEFLKTLCLDYANSDSHWDRIFSNQFPTCIHWCNEYMSYNSFSGMKINFESPMFKTTYKRLLKHYEVI